jgi:hypothetical protein
LISRVYFCLLLAFPCAVFADTVDETEIVYLLDLVAASDCIFVRNGDEHSAADAADHLRLKYGRGKSHVDSAEGFIDFLATESSWSGEPYTIICDGVSQPSAQWLHRALSDYRQQALPEPVQSR